MRVSRRLSAYVVAAVVAGPVVVSAVPAQAATEGEYAFSYVSQAGDYIGQGRSGTISDPAQLTMSGTAGSLTFRADTGSEYWHVSLAAPKGEQLTTGSYENVSRAPFNDAYGGLSVTSSGRGCNQVKGRFTIHAISAGSSGRVTSLDATLTQFCDSSTGGLTATVRYAAPEAAPIVLTSSDPVSVADQPVTLSARVAPGTGPVTFLDGAQVVGQASPDRDGLARITTAALAPGARELSARQDTATSARLVQVVRDADTSLWFRSVNGDYIGQGATSSFVPPGSEIALAGTASSVRASVDDPASGQWWYLDIAAAPGEPLVPGTYSGATRAAFRAAGEPGLDVHGSGRGCNTLTGSFVVHSIVTAPDGTVEALDVSFLQYCGSSTAPLAGRLRFAAPAAPEREPSDTALAATATGPLEATLTATVTGAGPAPGGEVVFTEGASTLGAATVAADGTATLVTTLSRGTHTVAAVYGGDARYDPSSASAQVSLDGFRTTAEISTDRRVKAGSSLRVDVVVRAEGSGAPTGVVHLYDGVEPVGTATSLASGGATIVWTPVGKGVRDLTVRYAGDDRFAGSVSQPVSVRVN